MSWSRESRVINFWPGMGVPQKIRMPHPWLREITCHMGWHGVTCHPSRDVTKVKNIHIRRMWIKILLFVEYRMWIANTKYQYYFSGMLKLPAQLLLISTCNALNHWSSLLICKLWQVEMSQTAENQLGTCAPVAILSDKWEIFWLFAFERKVSNYSMNIEYARSGQYSNVVEFEF